jgi:hypothetical protein
MRRSAVVALRRFHFGDDEAVVSEGFSCIDWAA